MIFQPYQELSQETDKMNEMPREQMDATGSMIGKSFTFLNIQTKLYEALHLLHEVFSKHQCYSRDFEIAYWQERQKLNELIETNKQLAQQLEERTISAGYRRWEGNLEDVKNFNFESFPEAFEPTTEEERQLSTPTPEIWLTNDAGRTTMVYHRNVKEQENYILENDDMGLSLSCEKDETSQ
jgi:hypothetical protein